jgi:hypothetical protein
MERYDDQANKTNSTQRPIEQMSLVQLLAEQTRMEPEERERRRQALHQRTELFDFSFDYSTKTKLQALKPISPVNADNYQRVAQEAEKLAKEFKDSTTKLRIDLEIDYYDGISSLVFDGRTKKWQQTEEFYRSYRVVAEADSPATLLKKMYVS